MNRIDKKFEQLKNEGRKALIIFITAGDPSLEITRQLILEMEQWGVDIIELGIPFSDPLADGPTIQNSSQRALEKKVNLKKILTLIKDVRKKTQIPLVLMSYLNPIYNFGLVKFAEKCHKVGVDGVIIPDLISEEAKRWEQVAEKVNLATIFLVTPTTKVKRIREIAHHTKGFLYYVSLTGVTGMRDSLDKKIKAELSLTKKVSGEIPLACGFGISNDKQAKEIATYCDGVIIGSAVVKIIDEGKDKEEILSKTGNFIKHIRQTLDSL